MTNTKIMTVALLACASSSVWADGSPWLPVPGSIDFSLSYNQQKADRLFAGDNNVPLNDELILDTYGIEAKYGISDNLSASLRTGYSQSDLKAGNDESGIQDTVLAVTWRLQDEFIEDPGMPSIALRFAGTIAGDYDVGKITAIGDGADGIEGSVVVGKFLTDAFAVSADYGYRHRDTGVSDERFGSVSAYYLLGDQWSFNLGYQVVDAVSGNDIGDAQFQANGGRFEITEKDYQLAAFGANYRVNEQFGIGLSYGDVVDGKNAADSDVFAINFDFSL